MTSAKLALRTATQLEVPKVNRAKELVANVGKTVLLKKLKKYRVTDLTCQTPFIVVLKIL